MESGLKPEFRVAMTGDSGLIARLAGVDLTETAIPVRRIQLAAKDAVVEQRRRQHWLAHRKSLIHDFMRRYRKLMRPACEAAMLD